MLAAQYARQVPWLGPGWDGNRPSLDAGSGADAVSGVVARTAADPPWSRLPVFMNDKRAQMKTDTRKSAASKALPAAARKRVSAARSQTRHANSSLEKGAAPSMRGPAASSRQGGPLALALSQIEEDPHQPRTADNPGFSAQSIAELAATIASRGVKSPISVRDHPTKPGRYLINHGARRFRASKVAGKTTIPAFVDNDY